MKKMDQESLISNARFCFVNVQNSIITNLQVSKILGKQIQLLHFELGELGLYVLIILIIDRWIQIDR